MTDQPSLPAIEIPALPSSPEYRLEPGHRIVIPHAIPQRPRCPPGAIDEIVVCATDREQFRLRALVPPAGIVVGGDGDATMTIGEGTTIGAEVEQGQVGGVTTNRLLMRLKRRF